MKNFPPEVPEGIPKIAPSLTTGCKYFFRLSKKVLIDLENAPYSDNQLAWFSACKEALKDYRNQVRLMVFSLGVLLFLVTQIQPLQPVYARAYFFSAPFKGIFFVVCWYMSLAVISFCILIALLLLTILLLFWFYERNSYNEVLYRFKHYFIKFDRYRSIVNFVGYTVTIIYIMWICHALLSVNFFINTSNGIEYRMLSGFEFLYFFAVTYTTLGFGDVVPASYGAKAIVLLINVYTLFSIVYWYNLLSSGPRRSVVTLHLKKLYKEHQKNIGIYKDLEKILKAYKTVIGDDERPCCPMLLKSKHNHTCPICSGENVVSYGVFFTYAIQTSMSMFKFVRIGLGMTRREFKSLNAGLDEAKLEILKQ